MILRELEGVELPCAVRITAVDVAHMACDDAPRNQGGLTVACCGEPLKGHLEPGEPEASDVLCPRCPSIAPGKCACWGDRHGWTYDRLRADRTSGGL